MILLSLLTFVVLAIWKGIPLRRWPLVWAAIIETHEAEIRAAIYELKCEGKIREDKDGFLWPK